MALQSFISSTTAPSASKTHLDIHDHNARQALAEFMGISDNKLKNAATLVGTRISAIYGSFGK